jgi:hypothetical protein
MWQEWIAKCLTGHDELHLVLVEDTAPTGNADERTCQLMVNRHHLSQDRQEIARVDFASLAEAQSYCLREYGIAPSDWRHEVTLSHTFQFDYTITNLGVPQPCPVVSPNAKILFRFSPAEDENGRISQVLNVCGTREGMERLAAMLLLCASSDKYDPEFHIHLEREELVETDLEVTIRAPLYLDTLSRGEFSEFKGTAINLPTNDVND